MSQEHPYTLEELVERMLVSGPGLSYVYDSYLNTAEKQILWQSIFEHYDNCEKEECKLLKTIDSWYDIVLKQMKVKHDV